MNRLRGGAWPLTCLLLVVASALVGWAAGRPGLPPEALAWHRADWPGAPWTLWSGPLLHRLAPHALANMLALGALAVLGAALAARPRDALALLLAWPLGTLGLRCWPQVAAYWGLSGTIHAAAAVLALRALATPERRWLGLLLGGGLAIKLALERGWSVPIGFDTGWGFNVVFAAHLSGAIAGALLALGLNTLASMRPARRHHS
ncbi:MAG TPA: hypothetical protein PKD71_11725 [Ottowia sp.]|nr:hypothetical protein [Ottowia sp.]